MPEQLLDEFFVISNNCFLIQCYRHTEHILFDIALRNHGLAIYRLVSYLLAENWQISPVGCVDFQN